MAGFSYNGSLLGRTPRVPTDVVAPTTKIQKRIRGIFRFEATPLLFADVDADFYLDIKQAARELDVTERSIARYRVAKQLPTHSLGERKNLFRKSVIDKIKNAV
ncbi:MAG: helix-turn-helix domain-containing protein [Leptospiraceae bacterium]|nr:helix-turn-helix domain-containing protein [Leptospiraceae bacterium]